MRSPLGRARLALLRRQQPRRLDRAQAAGEQVVDRPRARSARRGRSARAAARTAPASRAGRRLKSPPRTSGSAPDQSTAACAARATSAAACARPAPPRRAGSPRTRALRPGSSSRAHCIRRRSGRRASVSRRCSTTRPGWRTRIWFDPPSLEASRSGFQIGQRAPADTAHQLREVSTRTPLDRVRRASSREPARRRLLEQRDVPVEAVQDARRTRPAVADSPGREPRRARPPEQPRAEREQRRIGWEVASVVEVPAEDTHWRGIS